MSAGSLHMSSKRPTTKTSAPTGDWKITDEWGIYDPEKAGIPALFARLGRPILRAAPTSSRKERRRALRPERSSEGVGLALAEARRRAGYDQPEDALDHPLVGGNPARAMRLALRAQAAVNAMGTPAAEPFVPPPAPPVPHPPMETRVTVVPDADIHEAPAPKKRQAKRAVQARTATDAPTRHLAVEPAPQPAASAPKARARKTTTKARTRHAAPAVDAVAAVAAAPLPEVAPEPKPHVPPAPSPRRPRGPVPLAAWAHAVADQPKVEPRRADKRGFWRGLFRIPAEVALVEYAHGAKIHRLLIEAGDDHLPDFI
jgi:hypothetical protein